MILRVAIPCPLFSLFDYKANAQHEHYQVGMRVQVSFGNQKRQIGIIYEITNESPYLDKIKPIQNCLDQEPVLSSAQMALIQWMSHYYHLPIGETCFLFLPKKLREGAALFKAQIYYQNTNLGQSLFLADQFKTKRTKQALLHFLQSRQSEEAILAEFPSWKSHKKALMDEGIIERFIQEVSSSQLATDTHTDFCFPKLAFELNDEQKKAVAAICAAENQHQTILLDGITGSGKTAVYIAAIRHYLQKHQQILLLVPEIGLTPQLLERFKKALGFTPEIVHSNISDSERLNTYRKGLLTQAKLLIGTRSALFANLPKLGLIILDEEHDDSFRQNDGLRYSAKNTAIMQAFLKKIPIVLGSATPSLETLNNAFNEKYLHLKLQHRALGSIPDVFIIDNRREMLVNGLSKSLLQRIKKTLANDEQVMLFLNRRGFSPIIYCESCQFMIDCSNCDAHMIYHYKQHKLLCHHCGKQAPLPTKCPSCSQETLIPLGTGTQKIELTLQEYFPDHSILRIDRDSTSHKNTLDTFLKEISEQKHQIIIGTQMLAKGHDFANVTLAAFINVDNLLFSEDFRAEESLAQILTQFSGRAGRAKKKGQVLIQTHFPEHRIFNQLFLQGYRDYSRTLLEERQVAQLPPFSFQALIRGEAKSQEQLLHDFHSLLTKLQNDFHQLQLIYTPPIPANLSKKQNIHRAFILLQSKQRKNLHIALNLWQQIKSESKLKSRFLLDIDPIDFQ